MSAATATDALTGVIPVVVTGGVVMKFTDAMVSRGGSRRSTRSKGRKSTSKRKSAYSRRNSFGGVSPI